MTTAAVPTTLTTYQIDKAHSEVAFQVRHLISRVRGRFAEFDGTIVFAETDPESGQVAFTIQAASIDTSQPDRDAHLRSEDFFAAERYPTLTFASRSVRATGGNEFAVTGDLTIRGVTREVTLPVSYLGKAKDPWGNVKVAFETAVTLNRKDFGLNWNAVLETGGFLVGDDVRVSIALQAASK